MCMYSALHENILEMQLSDPQTYIIRNSGLESVIYILKAMQYLADMSKITHCLGIQTTFFFLPEMVPPVTREISTKHLLNNW